LVAQPHLHAANVDPALNQTGSAGMAQAVRHQLHIGRKADLRPCLMPDLPESRLLDAGEGAYALAVAACDGRGGAFSERDGAAPARLGEPESDAAFVNVAPAQADRLAKARAGIDQENAEKVIVFGTGLYGSEKPVFLVPFKESDAALAFFLPLEFRQA